jgi:hypothetical protein
MIGQADSQVHVVGFAQDFKCAQCESKDMLKMMLEKEWWCSLKWFVEIDLFLLFTSCSNGNRDVIAFGENILETTLSALGKGNEHKLLTSMTSNKNGCESIKNLEIVVTFGVANV